jgi:hypothetical protein
VTPTACGAWCRRGGRYGSARHARGKNARPADEAFRDRLGGPAIGTSRIADRCKPALDVSRRQAPALKSYIADELQQAAICGSWPDRNSLADSGAARDGWWADSLALSRRISARTDFAVIESDLEAFRSTLRDCRRAGS